MINNKLLKNYNIGLEFINYYYNTWINNPELLYNNNTIKNFTKFSYNSICYEGTEIVDLLKSIKSNYNIYFHDYTYEILDSNSRQLYILVTGKINNNTFSQTFNLMLIKNNIWIIINSLLIII